MSGIHNQKEWNNEMGFNIETIYNRILRPGDHDYDQAFRISPPSRYEDLFKAADEHHTFWRFLASCNNFEIKVSLDGYLLII